MANPILTDNQSIVNAENYRDLVVDDNATYIFIGRITPWDSDTSPPDPELSLRELEFNVWRTMAAAKKIQHIEHVIPVDVWSTGVVWDMYDDVVASLIAHNFYVLVEEGETRHIFKCLYNGDGAESTEKPGVPADLVNPEDFIVKTSGDGYVWFYMYQINDTLYDRYASSGYVPAVGGDDTRETSNDGAVDGKVYFVEVTASGSGYEDLEKEDLSISSVAQGSLQINIVDSTLNSDADFYNGCVVTEHDNDTNFHIVTDYSFNRGTNTGTFTLDNVDNITTAINVDIRAGVKINPTGDTNDDYRESVAYASLSATGGVDEVVILDGGQGYSFYTAEVNSSATSGSGAELRTIFAPEGGHGSNFIKELYAIYLTMTVDFEGNFDDKIYVNNDFRQYGILHNPSARSGNLSSLDTVDQRTTLELDGVSATVFSVDEEVTGDSTGAVGRVVSYDTASGTAALEIIGDSELFESGEGITGETSGATATISSISLGELKPFSGNVLYMKNLSPIIRSDNQIESVRLTLAF